MTDTSSAPSAVAAELESLSDVEEGLRRADVRRRWWFSAPALIIVALFSVGPLAIVVVYSFLTPGSYGDVVWEFSTDGWFSVLFSRDIFDGTVSIADAHLSILWRSVRLSIITTIATLVVGFPTAYFMASRSPRLRMVLLMLITVPFWTNLLIRVFAIQQLIRGDGLVNTTLMWLGIIDEPLQMMYTDPAILAGMVYVYLPLMVLPLFSNIEKFDFKLLEAAYDLYATRWKVLWNVILPLSKPGIVAGSVLVFIPCLGTYVIPRVMGGGKNMMIGNLIELQFGQGRNWPLGASLALSLTVLILVAYWLFSRKDKTGGNFYG